MSSVFAIFNESAPKGTDLVITEVVQPLRWTYEDALADLQAIAEDNEVFVDDEATSVYVPLTDSHHLESDEYYIVELEVGNRG